MSTLNKYLSLLVAVLLLNACSKDVIEPLPEGNSPVFHVSGQIDGQPIAISAGENGAFMNTSTSFVNNVKYYEGSLENAQTGFSIDLSDGMLDIPSFNSNIEDFESFTIAPYTYGTPLATYSISDFPNEEFISNIEWSVNGQVQSNSTLEIYEPGKYNICATVTFVDGTEGYSCNEALIGYQKNVNSVLRHIVTQYQNTIAYLDSPNEGIASIDWTVNDSIVSTSNSENYKTGLLALDHYRLGANVTFQNGAKRKKEIYVNTLNANNYIGDFSILENQSTLKWDHSATVIVRINEKKYRAIQNSSNTATITINDVTSFNNNSSGDQVSIFKGTVSCSFIDLSTEEVVEGEFDFSFGVAH
jgi:uncharacterized protein YkvS